MAPLKRPQVSLGPEYMDDSDGSSSGDDRGSNAPGSVQSVFKPSRKLLRSGLTITGRENALAGLIPLRPKEVKGASMMLFQTERPR